MDTQHDQQMFNDGNDPGTDDRRQKARDRMRRLRLERKAQIVSRKLLAATNLQRGERIVELASTDDEQASIDLLSSGQARTCTRQNQSTKRKQLTKTDMSYRAKRIATKTHHDSSLNQLKAIFADIRRPVTQLYNLQVEQSITKNDRTSKSVEGFFRRFTTPHTELTKSSSEETDSYSHQQSSSTTNHRHTPSSSHCGANLDHDRIGVVLLNTVSTTQSDPATVDLKVMRRRQVAAFRQQRHRDRQRASKGLPPRHREEKLLGVERMIEFTVQYGSQCEPKSSAIIHPAESEQGQEQPGGLPSSVSHIRPVQHCSSVVVASAIQTPRSSDARLSTDGLNTATMQAVPSGDDRGDCVQRQDDRNSDEEARTYQYMSQPPTTSKVFTVDPVTDSAQSSVAQKLCDKLLHGIHMPGPGVVMVSTSLAQSTHLFRRLVALRTQFQDWLLTWYNEIIGPPFRLVDILQCQEFTACYHQEADVFPRAYAYPSFSIALGHSTYWTMLLSLEEAIFDISALLFMPGRITLTYRIALLDATTECADCICSTAPYFILNSQVPTGSERLMYGTLLQVTRWYERIGSTAKAQFGRSILASQHNENVQAHDSSVDQINCICFDDSCGRMSSVVLLALSIDRLAVHAHDHSYAVANATRLV